MNWLTSPYMTEPVVESMPRRHGSLRAEYHAHRFPIKGGISRREAFQHSLIDGLSRNNSLIIRLKAKAAVT
jgi:hypothetical protein